MPSIETHLTPGCVDLAVTADSVSSALDTILGRLRGDERVRDFDAMLHAIKESNPPALCEGGCRILIAHGRTDAVNRLVLAAGRLPESPDLPRMIFAAGIPSAFSSEYLRVVGVIARACREESSCAGLLAATTPEDFISVLSRTGNSL